MAAPTYQAVVDTGAATAANFTTPTLAAVANDVIVVAVYLEPSIAVTPPDGTWTEKATIATTGTRMRVFWHRATGAETTYAFTHASTFRRALAVKIAGCALTGDPFDAVDIQFNNASGTTTVGVQVTTLGADRHLVWFASGIQGADAFASPSGLTERADTASITAGTGDFLTQGATGSLSGTCGATTDRIAFLGALAPPSALPPLSKPAGLIRRVTWHARRVFTQAIWSTVAVPEPGGPLALAATGQTISAGTATLGLAVPLAAVGSTTSSGTATLAQAVPLAASGTTTSGGTATLSGGAGGTPPTLTVGTPVDGTGSHVMSPPAGTAQGDLLLCYCWLDINTSTVATPSGWTLLHGPFDSTSAADARAYVFAKLAGASEGSTTFTDALGNRNWTSVMVRVTGNTTTALGSGNGDGAIDRTAISSPAAGTSVPSSTITPTVNNCLIVATAHADLSATSTPHWTPPSGWTEDLDRENASSFVSGTVAHIEQTTAAAISGTFTAAVSDEHVVHIVAVAPGAPPSGALTASGTTTSGGTAALSLAVPLTATGQTVSAGTAAPSLAVPITATGQTVSGGTATLGLAVPITATGQTVSGGTATLGLAVPLAAIGQTVSGGTATLSISGQIALTATGQTISGGTATLGLAVPLAATGQTVSGGTATLGFAVALTATGQTVSGGTAALVSALTATGQTISAGTATLSLARPLAATGQTVSGGTAAPSAAVPLAASGTTVSGGTATMSGSGALNATGQTISGGQAAPSAAVPLAAVGSTISAGTATLSLARPLAATGQTISAGTAAFGRLLAATGSTISSGTVAFGRLLNATGQTVSDGTASLRLAVPIAATGQTASAGVATLGMVRSLQAVGQTASGGTATLLAFVGEVVQWRGRVTVGRQQPTVAAGRGPARTVPSGPTGARGG